MVSLSHYESHTDFVVDLDDMFDSIEIYGKLPTCYRGILVHRESIQEKCVRLLEFCVFS